VREARLIKSAEELRVYGEAYKLAMEIFEISKQWPKEEKYSVILHPQSGWPQVAPQRGAFSSGKPRWSCI